MHPSTTRYAAGLLLAVCIGGAFADVAAQETPQTGTEIIGGANRMYGTAALSPDGKWLAFTQEPDESTSAIWIMPAAGGAPARLTSEGFHDIAIRWAPAGDRLYFQSNRAARDGDRSDYLMTLPIDPATGTAMGPARQVLLEPVDAAYAISPDGSQIAIVPAPGRNRLLIAPAVGGATREIAQAGGRLSNLAFTADGKSVVFVLMKRGEEGRSIMSVSTAGGKLTQLGETDAYRRQIAAVSPGGRYFALRVTGSGASRNHIDIIDNRGRMVQRIQTPRDYRPLQFTPDGRGLLVMQTDVIAPTRVMPVAGGSYREVTPREAYDWVGSWAADSRSLYTWSEVAGKPALLHVSAQGQQLRQVSNPAENDSWEYVSGRYGIAAKLADEFTPQRWTLVELASGKHRVLSEKAYSRPPFIVYGRGGVLSFDGDNALHFERRGDLMDLFMTTPAGERSLLRTLRADRVAGTVAVHGTRVAWPEVSDDGGQQLMIAEGPAGEARRLASAHTIGDETTFSQDGRWIATHYAASESDLDAAMAIVDAAGKLPPKLLRPGFLYWYWPRWLPDNSGVLVLAGTGTGSESHVALVPTQEGEPPVILTRDDPSPKWGFELSPDGKYIAYPGEIWRGSSIRRIELDLGS